MSYRFGFALTTALGNRTRYENLRKYADRDPTAECLWAPISHYLEPDPYRHLPGPVRHQLILNRQAAAVIAQWNALDAVVVHAFQLFAWLTLAKRRKHTPLLVFYQDYAPFRDVSMIANYGQQVRDTWRRRLRFQVEARFARRADLYILWSEWARELLVRDCGVPRERTHVVNVGVDLELWPFRPKPLNSAERPRILFVGGDFARKGGDLLLDVFLRHFADTAHLDLVTKQAPPNLPPCVSVYADLQPNDARLQQLYAGCDVFVLPTRADMSSFASIEAMATGRPVITTPIGGITDLVEDGVHGHLIRPGDGSALRDRLAALLADPALRQRMGAAGRARVQRELNAEHGAQRILTLLKEATAARRVRVGVRPGAADRPVP